jgi:hypothetical protein
LLLTPAVTVPQRVSAAAGFIAIGVGAIVLTGWTIGNDLLKGCRRLVADQIRSLRRNAGFIDTQPAHRRLESWN